MKTKTFRSPDGVEWTVSVQVPGASNACVIFRHPMGQSSRLDRYAWYISHGPEARSVTARLSPEKVLDSLDEAGIARLFRRSMRVSRPDPLLPVQASS